MRVGRFPKNPGVPWPLPTFVDAEGTRCAMAHLMETGGALEVVRAIANTSNFAFVRELARDAFFVEWLAAAGFTVDEAAAIQPTYCDQPAVCVCGGARTPLIAPAAGVLEATVATVGSETAGTRQGTATVTAIYGNAFGVRVGDVVSIAVFESDGLAQSQIALVPLHAKPMAGADGGTSALDALVLDPAGMPNRCLARQDLPGKHPTKQQTIAAMQSSTCVADLAKLDGKWDDACGMKDSACSFSPTGSHDPLGVAILLAVVGTMTRRRFAKR